jgi:hypothetical protein
MDELRMEEHLWAQESFIANIDLCGLTVHGLVNVLLEFVILEDSSRLIHCLLIILRILLNNIFAYVAESFLYFLSNFHSVITWDLLSSISHVLKYKLSDVFTSQRDVSHTTSNDEAVTHREHVSNTIP